MIVDQISGAVQTTVGVQDFTASFGGLTPKAGIFYLMPLTAAGQRDGYSLTVGVADSTGVYFSNIRSQWNISPTATKRSAGPGLNIYRPKNWPASVTLTFNEWIANGIRLNVTVADTNAFLLKGVLFAGPDVEAKAGTIALGSEDVSATVTTGFETKSCFMFGPGWEFLGGSSNAAEIGLGFYGSASKSYSRRDTSRGETTGTGAVIRDYALNRTALGGLIYGVLLDNVTTTSFDLTPRLGDANDEVGYLAFNKDATVAVIDTPTVTGNNAHNVGVTPICVISVPTMMTAEATVATDATSGAVGIGFTTESDETCGSVASDVGANPSDPECTLQDYIKINQDDGTSGIVAKFVSFDTTGWTWNYSATLGTARKWPVMVFPAEGTVAGPESEHLEIEGYSPAIATGPTAFVLTESVTVSGYIPKITQGNVGFAVKGSVSISGYIPDIIYTDREAYVKIGRHLGVVSGYAPTISSLQWTPREDPSTNPWYPLSDRSEKYEFH